MNSGSQYKNQGLSAAGSDVDIIVIYDGLSLTASNTTCGNSGPSPSQIPAPIRFKMTRKFFKTSTKSKFVRNRKSGVKTDG